MGNWTIKKHHFFIEWFNIKNELNDKPNKNIYFFKYFTFIYKGIGLTIQHAWQRSYFLFITNKNLYLFTFRDSPRYVDKGKFKLKFTKLKNDSTTPCGM